MIWLKTISSKVWGYVAATLVGLGLLYGVRSSGRTAEKNDNMNETLNVVRKRNEVQADVGKLSPTDVDKRLQQNDWVRK